MKISASVISNPGNVREKNEDNFYFDGIVLKENQTPGTYKLKSSTKQPILMGVFDGMGGISAGEKASLIAAETAMSIREESFSVGNIQENLVNICMRANERTCDEMIQVVKKRMGTTASMLCFYDSDFYLCNIGDSPIFLFRKGKMWEISHEHTEKENFVLIHGADAIPDKKKFKLTQHIGIFSEEMEIEPYTMSEEVQEGDRFIICSDGLTDMVEPEEIARVLARQESASKTTKILLEKALENGGKDNITIICVDIKNNFFGLI